MNRKELVTKVSGQLGMTAKDVDLILTTTLDVVKTTVKKGDNVALVGFGTFTKTKRAARAGVNPSTGAKIQIKANTVPKFVPGKMFKDLISTRK